jgi:16S rRNA (uracil1498-N3)-methyltransferase
MHRFFVPKDQILNETIEFDEDQIHHIKNVLKLVNGTKIEAFNGEYKSYLASVNYINKNVNADILEVKEEESSDFKLNIFQAIIKNQKLEYIVEKLTEIGISSFTPIISDRVQKNDIQSFSPNKIKRLRKISKESSEQSGKILIPKILKIKKFSEIIEEQINGSKILFYEENKVTKDISEINFLNQKEVSIIIGPVGGFSSKEVASARKNKFHIVNLGDSIFKSDTASIIATSLVRYLVAGRFNSI